jgi:hypothetical protein
MKISLFFVRVTKRLSILSVLSLVLCSAEMPAAAEPAFAFDSISTLDDMTSLIRTKFPLGTSRSDLRHTFVEEGHATLGIKAGAPNVEKYIYDIDLCHYYIWRWNISADYDDRGKLLQAYVNGNIVFPDGSPKKIVPTVADSGKKASIYRAQRPRPEAYKGENSLGFLLFDRDSDLSTKDDQTLIGSGPSRADPVDMGTMIAYTNVDPWRSIFDSDPADHIVPYAGGCEQADKIYEEQRQAQKR